MILTRRRSNGAKWHRRGAAAMGVCAADRLCEPPHCDAGLGRARLGGACLDSVSEMWLWMSEPKHSKHRVSFRREAPPLGDLIQVTQ